MIQKKTVNGGQQAEVVFRTASGSTTKQRMPSSPTSSARQTASSSWSAGVEPSSGLHHISALRKQLGTRADISRLGARRIRRRMQFARKMNRADMSEFPIVQRREVRLSAHAPPEAVTTDLGRGWAVPDSAPSDQGRGEMAARDKQLQRFLWSVGEARLHHRQGDPAARSE